MSIVSGARLAPYEIVAPLGAGGMGEVYLAEDTKLERKVAIKLLPRRRHRSGGSRNRGSAGSFSSRRAWRATFRPDT